MVQRIVRSHLIEKLGKVSRETGLIGESINQNKTRGAVVREHGLDLESNQPHSVGMCGLACTGITGDKP